MLTTNDRNLEFLGLRLNMARPQSGPIPRTRRLPIHQYGRFRLHPSHRLLRETPGFFSANVTGQARKRVPYSSWRRRNVYEIDQGHYLTRRTSSTIRRAVLSLFLSSVASTLLLAANQRTNQPSVSLNRSSRSLCQFKFL